MATDSFKTKWDKIVTVRKCPAGKSTIVTAEWDSADGKKIEAIDLRLSKAETKRVIRALLDTI